ncbi:RNA polymerase sigma factor [Streptomyces niveus]
MDRIDAQPVRQQLSPQSTERLDRLFRLHNRSVVALARSLANDAATGDDIAADAWLVAARWIDTLRADDDQAMGWLATLTRHAVRDYYKPRRNRERPSDWSDAAAAVALPVAAPAEDVALVSSPEVGLPGYLEDVVSMLPEPMATIVRLRAEGLTYEAISSQLSLTIGSVYWSAKCGIRMIRTALTDPQPAPAPPGPVQLPLPKREPGKHIDIAPTLALAG